MAVQVHSSEILYGLALLCCFGQLPLSSYVQHNVKPSAYIPTEFISSSSTHCPVDDPSYVASSTTCCSHCPPGLQQQDCQDDEYCHRISNSSLQISPFDAFGRCCLRPPNFDTMCPFGKPFLDGRHCCMNCGWMEVTSNLSGPCPDGYVCTTDPMDRHHAVCCPPALQEYTFSKCEGSWLGFIFYDGLLYDSNRGVVFNHTLNDMESITSVCCRQAGSIGAYGMIISGPHILSDIHLKCHHDQYAQSVRSSDQLRNLASELPENLSRWQSAYVIEANHGEHTPGFSFRVDPRFQANAKWIWVRQDGAAFVKPASTLSVDECVWCKGQLKDKTDVRELVGVYSYQDLKDLGGFVELFGLSNSSMFKIYVDLYSKDPECENITLKVASSGKSGTHEEITFDIVSKSYGADVRFCHQVGSSAGDCSPLFVIKDKSLTLCGQYRSVWITVGSDFIQFGSAFGGPCSEKQLTNWSGSVENEFKSLDRLSVTKMSRMRFFRSHSENRCMFMAHEVDELEPCGDGYISEEQTCLHCGCCYYPYVLPGRNYQHTTLCYRSLSSRYSQIVDRSSDPECHRSFEKVIGHFAFMIENNHSFLLNNSVTVEVLLQNSIRNIIVRIVFKNLVIADNVTLIRADKRVPKEAMYSYAGSLPVRFNHSGDHVLIAEIIGHNKDRLQRNLTVSIGRLTDIVSIEFESCSSYGTVVLFAIAVKGFDDKLMRMRVDFGDGTVLDRLDVDRSSEERPSWVKGKMLGQMVVLEHNYAVVSMYTAVLAVSSLNYGSVVTAQERVFVTLCNQDLLSFGKMIVFDSGFDQNYYLLDQVTLRVFVNDERLIGQTMSLTGLRLHWFCSTDDSWDFSTSNPDDDIPPESVQCFQQKFWLDSYAQMNKSRPESILSFAARDLSFHSVPQSYYFHVVLTKRGHRYTTSASPGTILLIRGPPPQLAINCHGNCGHNYNPAEAMVLYAKCHNCYAGESLALDWSLAQRPNGSSSQVQAPLDLRGGTIVYDQYFIVKSNGMKHLKKAMEYLVMVSARRSDGASGDASYAIAMQSPVELSMRYSTVVEEEVIYVHKDYLALLSIPIALIIGVTVGIMIRKRKERVTPAARPLQETVSQEEASDTKELENKELENKELENKELENKELENKELENKELENKELENKELENKELENKELENKEVDADTTNVTASQE